MNIRNILLTLIFLSLVFDGTIVSLPLVFTFALICYIFAPDASTVLILFLAGIILDILRVSGVGSTSAAMTLSYAFIYFYRRAFELKDYRILLVILLVLSFIYGKVFNYSGNLISYLLIFILAGVIFSYFSKSKFLW